MISKKIFTAISTVLVMGNVHAATTEMAPGEGMERCYGIAKAHMNDCSSKNNTCAGEANIDGDKTMWLSVPTGLCKRIVGGSLTPKNEAK